MTLRVQQFLRYGGTLNDLLAKYAIKGRRHAEFPNLVCLKYNQIDSPFEKVGKEFADATPNPKALPPRVRNGAAKGSPKAEVMRRRQMDAE